MLYMTEEEERAALFPIILCEYESNGGLADEKLIKNIEPEQEIDMYRSRRLTE